MIQIVWFYFILLHVITTITETPQHVIETNNVIAEIQEKAKHPDKPGALEDIVNLYEKLKGLAPDIAATLSSYIDKLKNLVQPTEKLPITEEKKPEEKKETEQTSITPNAPQPIPTQPTVSQEIVKRLDQTAEAIKQAAASTSTILHQKAEQLCQSLLTIDLKSADKSTTEKADEIQTACSNLSKQITAVLPDIQETVIKQTSAMAETIQEAVKEGKEKAKKEIQELCECVKQAANTFKEKVENEWNKVKNKCTPILASKSESSTTKKAIEQTPTISNQLEGQPIKVEIISKTGTPSFAQPKTIKIAEKANEKLPSSIAKKAVEKTVSNPFFVPESSSKQISTPISTDTPNPFALSDNPFLSPTPTKELATKSSKDKVTAVEKQAPITKKAELKIKESHFEKLLAQLADFFTHLNNQNSKKVLVEQGNVTYLTTKDDIQLIESMYTLYEKLSNSDEKNAAKSTFSTTIKEYTNLLSKQIEQISTLVDNTLKKRINYLVVWLDINANIACELPKQNKEPESIAFDIFSDWKKNAEKGVAALKKQAETFKKQAEAIVCSDEELLFTQKGKEWEAVTTKTQVEKMIEECNTSIAIVQKGIAEPVARLIHANLKDILQDNAIKNLQKACDSLIKVTENTVNFNQDIKTSKEQFFKDNGDLAIMYNLWIRYFKKHMVGKSKSTWTEDQKNALNSFNSNYFIPLHETMKLLEPVSLQKEIFKKMSATIDQYIKDND